MKALQTQFDDKRLSKAVATPTCSSCCCCCCCLATSVASSTLLAQRIAKEGEKHQVFNRHLLTVLAALFVPVTGALVYFGYWSLNTLLRTCSDQTFGYSTSGDLPSYTVCTNPGSVGAVPLLIIVPFLVLSYLYARVRLENPLKRATIVTGCIAVAFVAEFFGGAALILTGVGGLIYLLLVPIVIGWITVWYHGHLGREDNNNSVVPSIDAVYPPHEEVTEYYDEVTTSTEEPPQQNPPAASPQ